VLKSISTLTQKDSQKQVSSLLQILAKYEEKKFDVLNSLLNKIKKTKAVDYSTFGRVALVQFICCLSSKLNETLFKDVYLTISSILNVSYQRSNSNLLLETKISKIVQKFYSQNLVKK
jgi:hypothetical protein